MLRKKVRIPKQIAVDILNEFGKIDDGLEFIDLNRDDPEAKKNFQSMIKRCDESELKVKNFELLCQRYSIKLAKYRSFRQFLTDLDLDEKRRDKNSLYFDQIESELLEDEKTMNELVHSYSDLIESLQIIEEKIAVLSKVRQLINTSHEDK